MSQIALNPDSTIVAGGAVTGAGGDHDAALADTSDSTFILYTGVTNCIVGLSSASAIPATAVVKAVVGGATCMNLAWGSNVPNLLHVFNPGGWDQSTTYAKAVSNTTFGGRFTFYREYPYTVSDLNSATLTVGNYSGGSPPAILQVSKSWVTVIYVTRPVTPDVIAPTGTVTDDTQPLILWSESMDADGGKRTHFQVRVFTAAQYGAAGFDPEKSVSFVDSGIKAEAGTVSWLGGWDADQALPNDTYRAYVRYGQTLHGKQHWSPWGFEQFTMNVPVPNAPTLGALPNPAQARNTITITDGGGAVMTDRFEVQRASPDGGKYTAPGDLRPALWLPLGEPGVQTNTFKDRSGNARHATLYQNEPPIPGATNPADKQIVAGFPGPFPGLEDQAVEFNPYNGGAQGLRVPWKTWRNYAKNPRFAGGSTATWLAVAPFLNGGAVLTGMGGGGGPPAVSGPEGVATYGQMVMSNSGFQYMGSAQQLVGTFRSGVTYTASIYCWQTGGTSTDLQMIFGDNADINTLLLSTVGIGAGWTRVTVSWTPSANRTSAQLAIRNAAAIGVSKTLLISGLVIYRGTAADYPGYFDGAQHPTENTLTAQNPVTYAEHKNVFGTGEEGWTDVAHASASDWGPFANGTVRTFTGWANRQSEGTYMMLMLGNSSGAGSNMPRLYLAPSPSGANVYWEPNQGGSLNTWTTWPGLNQWVHWALVANEPGNSAMLYLNGVLQYAHTQPDQYQPDQKDLQIGIDMVDGLPGSYWFSGRLAHQAVYLRGLSAGEVKDLYDAGAEADWEPARTIEGDGIVSVPSVIAQASTADTADTASHVVTLPLPTRGQIEEDDLLIAVAGIDGNSPLVWPDGWTAIKDDAGNGSAVRAGVAYRRCEGGETGTITVTSGGSEGGGWQIMLVRGAHPSHAPEVSVGVNSSGTNPDPDALTPTGWANENTLWIAAMVNDGNVAVFGYPAGYFGGANPRWANASGAGAATCFRRATTNSENPIGFGMSAEDSRAFTIGVRPPRAEPLLLDYDAENGETVRYRARAHHDYTDGGVAMSPWSAVKEATWTDTAAWWLKHPFDPTKNVNPLLRSSPNQSRPSRQGIFQPLGSEVAVVVTDTRGAWQGELAFLLDTEEEREALAALLADGVPLLLNPPAGVDYPTRWLSFGDYNSERSHDSLYANITFDAVPFVHVARPPGRLVAGSY